MNRKPSTQTPSSAQRSFTRSRSASLMPRSDLRFLPIPKGSDGWDSTGASTVSSTIMARANPPVKHMPTTPTPGPPHTSCSWRASARNHTVTGDVRRSAIVTNSRETHPNELDWKNVRRTRRLAGRPEQHGQDGRAAEVGHPPAEIEHGRRHAGDLGDHDDGRPAPAFVHRAGLAFRRERALREPLEVIVRCIAHDERS